MRKRKNTMNNPAQPEPGVPDADTAASVDPVDSNIAIIAEMRARAELQVDRHQRFAETITGWLGRPWFLYLLIALMVAWVIANVFANRLGLRTWDPPPFNLLISLVNVGALLMATVVLITQNRQGKMAARREHLDLQVNLLTEQRTAKIISLLEELRRDMPTVHNRIDPEADALAARVDPNVVLTALENKMAEVLEGAAHTDAAKQSEPEAGDTVNTPITAN